jgi:hypothetical protein
MNEKLLITFGCSWTQGVGVGYQVGQTMDEYRAIAWDRSICSSMSFRGILSKQFLLDNKNFARGGSSNQAQFDSATKYFGSSDFVHDQDEYEQIIVLHGITSTSRDVFFDLETMSALHVKYDMPGKFGEFMLKHSYDHDYEVRQLEDKMNFWNVFYASVGIKNIWVDTFNHHCYDHHVNNMITNTDMINDENRDLMSQLCTKNNMKKFDKKYHFSSWKVDSDRVSFLIDKGLLNPLSNHPTEQGHIQIANFIAPVLESKL